MKKPKTTPFSRAQRKARPLIESGKEFYICGALLETGGRTFCRRIMQQLEGHSSYGAWVMCKRRDAWHRMQEIGIDAFKAGRLAWIDDMIRREEK